jgi:hypothetical protein
MMPVLRDVLCNPVMALFVIPALIAYLIPWRR